MRKLSVVIASLVMAGCTWTPSQTAQNIYVETPGADGAECTLQNSDRTYKIVTPGATRVERSPEPLQVTCALPGYSTEWREIVPGKEPRAFWNVKDGVVPDTSSPVIGKERAMYRYPVHLMISMERLAAGDVMATPIEAVPVEAVQVDDGPGGMKMNDNGGMAVEVFMDEPAADGMAATDSWMDDGYQGEEDPGMLMRQEPNRPHEMDSMDSSMYGNEDPMPVFDEGYGDAPLPEPLIDDMSGGGSYMDEPEGSWNMPASSGSSEGSGDLEVCKAGHC